MTERDPGEVTSNDLKELRVLVKSPGWLVFKRLFSANIDSQNANLLDLRPEPGEESSKFLWRHGDISGAIRGSILALTFPESIIESAQEYENAPREEEPGPEQTDS